MSSGDSSETAEGTGGHREAEPAGEGPEITHGFITSTALSISQHSGTLPPAEEVARYGQINPGFPERIFRLAEEEAAHRREAERNALEAEIRDARTAREQKRRGQWLGFAIAVLFLIGGVTVTLMDYPFVYDRRNEDFHA